MTNRKIENIRVYEYNNAEGSYTTLKIAEIEQKHNNIYETYAANNRNKVMDS